MPKLYLVGVTEDRTGLVLAKSRRAKRGDSILEVDGDVLEAIAEIRRFRSADAYDLPVSSPALPTRHRSGGEGVPESRLSPREIQARLRRGQSIRAVARAAGVEEWRVEVYAAPIVAEQTRIVSRARELVLEKRGSGPSGLALGDAVQANIVDKRVPLTVEEFEAAWSAYEPEPDRWVVRFEYVSRGRDQLAEWHFDPGADVVVAANRLATVLGWRDAKGSRRVPPLPHAEPREESRRPKTRRGKAPARKPSKPPAKRARVKKSGSANAAATQSASGRAKKSPAKKSGSAKASGARKKPAAAKKPRGTAAQPSGKKPSPKRSKNSTAKPTPHRSGSSKASAATKKSGAKRARSSRSRSSPKGGSKRTPPSPGGARAGPVASRSASDEPPPSAWRDELDRLRGGSAREASSWREELARRLAEDDERSRRHGPPSPDDTAVLEPALEPPPWARGAPGRSAPATGTSVEPDQSDGRRRETGSEEDDSPATGIGEDGSVRPTRPSVRATPVRGASRRRRSRVRPLRGR